MQKVLLLSDLHLREAGKTIIGLDPLARFKAALDQAITDHPDADHLILMGDLTHSGLPAEYDVLRGAIAHCPISVTMMIGNHDHRATLGAAFPDAPRTPQGHVQRVLDLPHHRIITLDTYTQTPDPKHSGYLCADRLAWLQEVLETREERIPLVFAHHPPHAIGLPGMDAIALRNGDDLLDMLQSTGAHLFCGHVHRTISGQIRGIPYAIFKSPCHQAPLDLVSDDSTLSTPEPGAYGLLLLSRDSIIVHSEDVGLGLSPTSGNDALPETA